MHHFSVLVLLVASPALAAEATAKNSDPLVEVAWKEGADTARFAVPLPPEKSCSEVEVDEMASKVKIKVCRDVGDTDAPQLVFSIERVDRAPAAGDRPATWSAEVSLHATLRLRRGAMLPLGVFQRAKGANMVSALLR